MELKVKIAGDEAMRAQFRCSVSYDRALNYCRLRSHFLKNLFLKPKCFCTHQMKFAVQLVPNLSVHSTKIKPKLPIHYKASGAPLSRRARASEAQYPRKYGNLRIREILVITWLYARPSAPRAYQRKRAQWTGMVWRKVFPLWNKFKAQRELGALGAWLTIKLGKTRLKWQLACGEELSLLCRTGIKPLTGTAVDETVLNLVPTAFILQRIKQQ